MTAVRQLLGRFCLAAVICMTAAHALASPVAQAQTCAELIADGGFETGGAWQLGATPVSPEYVTSTWHAGGRSLALGIMQGANVESYSSAKQFVSIPADAAQARLSFWYSAVVGAQAGADKMQLVLLDPDGITLAVLWTSDTDSPTWTQQTYDMTPWRGRTVQVYFNVFNDGAGGTTGMYLDDVSLAACPNGAPAGATAAFVEAGDGQALDQPAAASPGAVEEAPAAAETPADLLDTPESYPTAEEAPASVEPFSTAPEASMSVEPLPANPEALSTPVSPAGSGTPALIFFTPTAGPVGSATSESELRAAAGATATVGAGAATPQFTRVSLMVTPALTLTSRATRSPAVALATRSAAAPQASNAPPFAQWPKGWWFAVGAVLAIILAAGLVSRR
jgi:hypothetical protein